MPGEKLPKTIKPSDLVIENFEHLPPEDIQRILDVISSVGATALYSVEKQDDAEHQYAPVEEELLKTPISRQSFVEYAKLTGTRANRSSIDYLIRAYHFLHFAFENRVSEMQEREINEFHAILDLPLKVGEGITAEQIASHTRRDEVWVEFGSLVETLEWMEKKFDESGNSPVYGIGESSLRHLRGFVDYFCRHPEDLEKVVPDKEAPSPIPSPDEFKLKTNSPYVERLEIYGQQIAVVTVEAIDRFAQDNNVPPEEYRRRKVLLKNVISMWQWKIWHDTSKDNGYDGRQISQKDIVLDDDGFILMPRNNKKDSTYLMTVDKFVESIWLCLTPEGRRSGDFRYGISGVGDKTTAFIFRYINELHESDNSM
jgi:hypothetical protein